MNNSIEEYNKSIKDDYVKQRESYYQNGLALVDRYISNSNLINLSQSNVLELSKEKKKFDYIKLYRIDKLVFDNKENNLEKMISVYNTLLDLEASVLLIINSKGNKVELYLGVLSYKNPSACQEILRQSIEGNFFGSKIYNLLDEDIQNLLTEVTANGPKYKNKVKNISAVSLIPSTREKSYTSYIQGIEKFIDSMRKESYTAIFIAESVNYTTLQKIKRDLEGMYSVISPYSKTSFNFGRNESSSIANSVNENFNLTVSKGKSESRSNSNSDTDSYSNGSYSSSTSFTETITNSESKNQGTGKGRTDAVSKGESGSFTINYSNKSIQVLMEKIDLKFERIKKCEAYGAWNASAYFISEDVQTCNIASNIYKSLMIGNESSSERSIINLWRGENGVNTKKVLEYLKYCNHPRLSKKSDINKRNEEVIPAYLVNTNELSTMMALPNKSVLGVSVIEKAEFGRDIIYDINCIDKNLKASEVNNRREIKLGEILHMGELVSQNIRLDIDSLTGHCFITGSTGSGKSNTVYELISALHNKKIKFLVIEPAKGEYRKVFGNIENINIFTTNPNTSRVLRINPFVFNKKIHVLEHLDNLMEIFNACWPMYAAMPAMLKEALERSYSQYGWDLINSLNIKGINRYPTFNDVAKNLSKVIKESKYTPKSKLDYEGALLTRIYSLTNGLVGEVFCRNLMVNEEELFDENTIIDLSGIGSADTKSLIMGMLIMQLNEYRKAKAERENENLKHFTVLEEAHNILRKTSGESGDNARIAGKSVELLCNAIAEMRTYGEGFIIVDQSPTAVDIAAIKNTNTKILMKLHDANDCNIMGRALSLNESQIFEIPKLKTGEAIIMQNNWQQPVMSKINRYNNKYYLSDSSSYFKNLCKLRLSLIEALYYQCCSKEYKKDQLLSLIDSRKEYSDISLMIENLFNKVDGNITSNSIGEFIINLLYAYKLFEIFKLNDKYKTLEKYKDTDIKELKGWVKEIRRATKYYIKSNNDEIQKFIEDKIIYYRMNVLKKLGWKGDKIWTKIINNCNDNS